MQNRKAKQRVSSTDFKNHYGKYVKQIQATEEPIDITRNGNVIFTIVPPTKPDRQVMLDSLVGIIPDEGQTKRTIRDERMRGKYGCLMSP